MLRCHPLTNWVWFILEHQNGECFGLVAGFENEMGYFQLEELERNNVYQFLPWTPIPLSKAKVLLLEGGEIDLGSAA
jgi:hypothetical protein